MVVMVVALILIPVVSLTGASVLRTFLSWRSCKYVFFCFFFLFNIDCLVDSIISSEVCPCFLSKTVARWILLCCCCM